MTKMVTTELDVDINLWRTVRVTITHRQDANPLDLFSRDNHSPDAYEAKEDVVWRAEQRYGEGVRDIGFEIVGVRVAK